MRRGQMVAGRYRLDSSVGAGGMGVVWRATDTELRRDVALKRADGGGDSEQLRREARIAAGLHHPNVVSVFDVIVEDGERWLVLEYLDARDLATVLRDEGPLPPKDTARIGAQLASALVAMHAKGMVHRDVTPANVLVTADGTAKLTDLGIAVWSEVTQTGGGQFGGTPGYVAPEVADGEQATARSDVYSLGAVLFAAVEGGSPVGPTDNPFRALKRSAAGELEPIRNAGPLTPVLTSLLATDPARRPAAERALTLLTAVADGEATTLPAVDGAAAPAFWRRPLVRRGAYGVVGLVAVLAAVWIFHPSGADPSSTPPPRPATATGADLVGDPQTADPCSLTDASSLDKYGQSQLVTDYGNFNRCDVLLQPRSGGDADGDQVDVKVELEAPGENDNEGTPAQHTSVAAVTLRRVSQQQDDCERDLLLPHGYQIDVSTAFDGDDYHALDLCGMADAVTSGALIVLGRGPVPRRTPLPAASLAHEDACALLTPADYGPVLGGGVDRTAGFGGWDCDWTATNGPNEVQLTFDRTDPGSLTDGTHQRLAGRDAYVFAGDGGDQTCEVDVLYRKFTDAANQPTADVVEVVLNGNQPGARLCGPATTLATAAAGRLPHAP